jgi:sugar phosphate isomerase/epimerase
MARKIIVVTAAYGNDHVKSLGGQAAVLPFIADAGADGVEIRRELFSAEELNALPALAATIERHGLLACYSAPQALFTDNGELNPDLPTLLAEAQTLNALWLKLSLGHFLHNQQLGAARYPQRQRHGAGGRKRPDRLRPAGADAALQSRLPGPSAAVTLTFDMGNWLWVGDSPEEAARHLAPAVSYIHVKAAEPHHEKFRAVPPDQAAERWLALLDNLPADAPRGIEFPLTGHDLTAVTRRYVNLLRED